MSECNRKLGKKKIRNEKAWKRNVAKTNRK